jgi:hypothetical protein
MTESDLAPGIHSLPAERYFAASGVSKSMLDLLADKTPAHLKAYLDGEREKETAAMQFGTVLHRALLEPDTYRGAFHIRPEGMRFTTKDGIAWQAAHNDKPILSLTEAKQIDAMVWNVHNHPFAKRLLAGGLPEQSIFVLDDHGTLRKSRLDMLTQGTVVPDIKTCESASLDNFERNISKYRWHVQAAYYIDNCKLAGIEKTAFFFVCVEKTPPFAVRCLQLVDEAVNIGRTLYQRDIQIYRNCVESGEWPAWESGFSEASLPAYEMKRMELAA